MTLMTHDTLDTPWVKCRIKSVEFSDKISCHLFVNRNAIAVPLQCQKKEIEMLPHEAVKFPTCTKKFPLTRAQPENFLRQRKIIYKPFKTFLLC